MDDDDEVFDTDGSHNVSNVDSKNSNKVISF